MYDPKSFSDFYAQASNTQEPLGDLPNIFAGTPFFSTQPFPCFQSFDPSFFPVLDPSFFNLPPPFRIPEHKSYTKKIGTISPEERRLKIERFLEKRQRRNFGKKISYGCRKRVADNRIRIKGRFVTKAQAGALKGLENGKNNVPLPLIQKYLEDE